MTFTEVFGDSPRVKLLDFLADHLDFDYTISQLNEFTGISRPTLYDVLRELQEDDMVILTRLIGDSRFFRLNTQNPKVVSMLQADFARINKDLYALGGRGLARPRRYILSSPEGHVGYMTGPALFESTELFTAKKSTSRRKGRTSRGRKPSRSRGKSSRRGASGLPKRSRK